MFDYLIKGGTVVDGTGKPGIPSDVAVKDGRIVQVAASIDGEAAETIDATGKIVCPGFVDPHTHYDAQLFWDPAASPSNLHGVTTVIGGNCGFTLAPLTPGDGDYIRRMMAKVEGMPLPALEQGLDWNWESFGEWLNRLDGKIGVNAGFLVGHCAIRRKVMGADAIGSEASDEQIAAMRALLKESIEAGGLGFSTGRGSHEDGDGNPVASRWATDGEILDLCREVAQHEGTTLEVILKGCLDRFDEDEIEFITEMSIAGERPVNWNVLTIDSKDPGRKNHQLAASDAAAASGGRVVALTMPILVGMNMSFLTFCALNLIPGWGEILALPVDERMAKLSDPAVRSELNERSQSDEAGVFRRLSGWTRYKIGDTFAPEVKEYEGRVVGDIAAERGVDPFDALLDIVIADGLRTVLWPGAEDDDDLSWKLRAEAWDHPHAMIGGSDAGAHLDRMCGQPYTTQWIGDCLRGRKLVSVERAIQMLTDEPARLFGLRERGQVREGWHADLVMFDPETVDAGEVKTVFDLPGETKRLTADAVGVDLVLVNGKPSIQGGVPTGATSGTLLRSGRDTETVLVPGR